MLSIRSIALLLTFLFAVTSSMSVVQDRPDCCVKTICKEIDMDLVDHSAIKCHRQETCGEVCKREPPEVTTKYFTKRANYMKQYCLFEQCSTYTFDCVQCPEPEDPAFRIHDIRSDCLKCYY